jgi:tripeptide aminopeptidase
MNSAAHLKIVELMSISGPPTEEQQVAAFLRSAIEKLGVPADNIVTDDAHRQSGNCGKSGNLIVRLPGKSGGATRMFSAHMDTVPGAVGAIPRINEVQGRVVNDAPDRALGGDNRAGCAVLLEVARALCAAHGNHPPTVLVFFVQEELGLVGAHGLDVEQLGSPKPTMCFNFDGEKTDEIETSVIGTRRFSILVEGLASHAGMTPEKGISAGLIAAKALAQLDRDGWHGVISTPEGKGSANLGEANGGTGTNVVMPSFKILAEARSFDPRFRDRIVDQWKRAFVEAAAAESNVDGATGKVSFQPGPCYEPFSQSDNEPVVEFTLKAARKLGIAAHSSSSSGGCDANETVAAGIPTVTIGVGQRNVHTIQEWLDLHDFDLTCQLAIELATTQ